MAMTVNNTTTLSLLNILNNTSSAQKNVLNQMATGSKINRGADDPAGLLAMTSLGSELTAVNAGISNNQRTDAVLGVADNALGEMSSLVEEIHRLASETANDAGLSADEIAANQSQIDDALASIDRIVSGTNFNGKKLLDGSLAINTSASATGRVTDVKVFGRPSGSSDTTLAIKLVSAAGVASAISVMTTSTSSAASFSVQGKLGTSVIGIDADENVSSVAAKVNASKAQTGVSAVMSGTHMNLYSTDTGSSAFVRARLITGTGITDKSDTGVDASVTVNGATTAVDGGHVSYSGGGVSMSFDIGTLGAGSTVNVVVKGGDDGGGATFQLGTTQETLATLGIDGVYSSQLGNKTDGYLKSLASGGTNSLVNNPSQAAKIARAASTQIATLQGRIGGFQKLQVRTSINALNDTKEGLEAARSVINDVDYAVASAELNKQNVLLQSAMSLLGLANQQTAQVLSLLQ